MGVGQLSESDAVDALRLPFYSSSHPTGSHGWRNQFDLGNPDYKGLRLVFPNPFLLRNWLNSSIFKVSRQAPELFPKPPKTAVPVEHETMFPTKEPRPSKRSLRVVGALHFNFYRP